MSSKAFIGERIRIYSGQDVDPNDDEQIVAVLRDKFNLRLPQRRSMEESLESVASDHEIISLILQYRAMKS